MHSILMLIMLTAAQFVNAGASEFSDKAVLIKELDGDKVKGTFVGYLSKDEKTSTFRPKHLTFFAGNFLAVCLNEDFSLCTLNSTFAEIYESAFKNATGRFNPDISKFPVMPAFPAIVKTNVINFDDSSIVLKVDFAGRATTYRIEKNTKLSSTNLKISTLSKDESIRKDISEVDDKLKQLAFSVIQIEKESDGNNTLHDSAGFGTGFFLSDDGLMMTNHHVISMYPDCLYKLYCDIKLNQTLPDNSKKVYIAKAYLMAMSVSNDFALIKIQVPKDMTIAKLAIDLETSGEDLITFGFPGDRRNSNDQTTKLTFSFGKLTGFSGLGFISSAYIAAGASGSPILNLENMAITGIVSNGTGTSGTPEGDPGIFRPISLLDSEFGITDYLDGSKQKRIKVILEKLSTVTNSKEAQELLDLTFAEKTYYALPYLKLLMVNHKIAEVRKAILQTLQKMEVVGGK